MTPTRSRIAQTLQLLWRQHREQDDRPSPGPRPRLDVNQIVDAAIAHADADPAGEVSMRAVARRLDVSPMALYGYVLDKDTLLALMYDQIHAGLPAPGDGRSIREWAEDLVDVYVSHPWAIAVAYDRPILGPHEQRVVEDLARCLRTAGVEAPKARGMVGAILHLVRGTAQAIVGARRAQQKSGVTEDAWWQEASGALGEVVPDFVESFPATVWLLSGRGAGEVDRGSGYVESQSLANLRVGLDLLLGGSV